MRFLVDRRRVHQELRHVVICEIVQSSFKAEVLEAMLLCRSRVGGLTCHPISCFQVCTLTSGCWGQVERMCVSLGEHFRCCFQTESLWGCEKSCFTLAAIPPSCVRLGPMGVFQWHRGELCTRFCSRRDGLDGGTRAPGSKYLGTTHAGAVNAK
jgi:hypothetical protein